MPSNNATPISGALSGATSVATQLGRNEYCTPTMAVSPPHMYSSVRAALGLIQPVPVGVATTRIFRSNAPVRSSSATARATRSSTEPAESSPTYARIGCLGSTVLSNSRMSFTVGVSPTNVRPWKPSSSNLISEPGPPEMNSEVGSTMPSAVPVSSAPKLVSAHCAN